MLMSMQRMINNTLFCIFVLKKDQYTCSKHCLLKGANPNYEKDGKTPLFYAFERERIDVVTILRQYTKKPIDEDQLKKQIDSNKNSSQTTQSNMQAHPEEQLTEQQKQANIKSAEEVKAQGNTLFQSGKYEEALATYNQAYKLNSQNVQIITNIAACQNKLKLYKEAIETCKLARQIDKSWTKLYYREGAVSYTHLTLPTICSVQISVVAVSLKKKK
eukprot:TRINITY_DN2883_c0_g1_i4.p1 TRINITY_DN2883_c0_g1~~TRINITY_DN2883_c0_g1_i4.p1  ORF type:complete len:217 (-),score=50.46 TRINITY_DN2883_c0_g1_i4:97-747(-)